MQSQLNLDALVTKRSHVRVQVPVDTLLAIVVAGNEINRPSHTITSDPPIVAEDMLSIGALEESPEVASFSDREPYISAPSVDVWSSLANSKCK